MDTPYPPHISDPIAAALALAWLRRAAATPWQDYDAAEAGTALRQHAAVIVAHIEALTAERTLAERAHCSVCGCSDAERGLAGATDPLDAFLGRVVRDCVEGR